MVNQQFSQGVLLLVVEGEVQQDVMYVLEDNQEVLIGRDANCDICLDYDTNISRRHASILPLGGGEWEIVDHQSSNGTYVNGKQLQSAQILHPGDRLMFSQGGPQFVFESRTPVTMAIEESQSEVVATPETIETLKYRLEIFPRKLICKVKNTKNNLNFLSIFSVFFMFFFLPLIIFFFLPLILIQLLIQSESIYESIHSLLFISGILLFVVIMCYFYPSVISYEFNLDTKKFTIRSQSLFNRQFNHYQYRSYPLAELAGVRLQKSVYEGDEGTKYNDYQVEFVCQNKPKIPLVFRWRTNKQYTDDKIVAEATQLIDWIEKYLENS